MGAPEVIYTEEFPPFNLMSADKKISGYSTEILHRMLDNAGEKDEKRNIQLVPWARAYRNAQKEGSRSLLYSTTRTKERETLFRWVGPIYDIKDAIFYYGDQPKLVEKVSDLSDERVLVVREDACDFKLREAGHPIDHIIQKVDPDELIEKMQKGSIPYVSFNRDYFLRHAKRKGVDMSKLRIVYTYPPSSLYFAFNKVFSDLEIKRYQESLDQVLSDKKFIFKLQEKYFSK